jgi:hypothetical protein
MTGMGGEIEYKRTCRKCGGVWFVAASELKGPSLGELFDKGVGIGRISQRGKDLRELHRNADERIKGLGRCPQCRSTDFIQTSG